MSEAAHEAFTAAKQIQALMVDLMTSLEALGNDTSMPTQQRHLIIKQVCCMFSAEYGVIEGYAKEYLDNNVEPCKLKAVEGFLLRDEESNDTLFVAGMMYESKPTKKIEILNKDTNSWGQLMKLLVDNNLADAVQQRLTVSKFDGVDLSKFGGMLNIKDDSQWSITKPKAPKKG